MLAPRSSPPGYLSLMAAPSITPVPFTGRYRTWRALRALDAGAIVQRHLRGDEQAFGILVDRYQRPLLHFIARRVGDRERSQALAEEVFIRVFRHLGRIDHSQDFSRWIYTIASILARKERREV
jgi:RNA polymerase sigma-70 factor (ECF subfamily)